MYFSWIDPPICARARQIIPGLLKRVNRLEGDLGRRELQGEVVVDVAHCFLDCDVPL
ncbi:hypothetical protein PHJA_000961900 [Phtheirospermum japonicum]|uniref:Uncharacterized protein n=1 Tax=Phtheirospermum japonicum TaxID=374723 RepID=A0A830BQ45_9LAMI|nr:hypothetical protein PHJA_000961900 [Phtheirospermum japonicum]